MNEHEVFQPTEAWPLQEAYKRQLHEGIQKWCEYVAPIFEGTDLEEAESKKDFFRFLMESVVRGDSRTANLIKTLETAMHESSRSWYSGKLGSWDKSMLERLSQNDFYTLYGIYSAGKSSASQ